MKFGPVRVEEAEGAMLAHATAVGDRRLRKAHRLTSEDVSLLKQAGISEVMAAVPFADDLDEDAAATAITGSMRFHGIHAKPAATGRVNLHACESGLFTVDHKLVDRLNAIDPAITLATVAAFKAVEKGDMVATVKIIPFAVGRSVVEEAGTLVAQSEIFAVHPYRPAKVSLVQTTLPSLKESILSKTMRVMAARLARLGSVIGNEVRTAHEANALAEAIVISAATSDMVIVFGASALCDFDDVIPAAIRQAGGEVIRAGMPVDPGNLLVLGRLAGKPVIGAPGCARSPKENGFDWVLNRLFAGLDVTGADIAGMGVGGLLMEIPTRPQPRSAPATSSAVAVHAVVLAAGRSSRMGGPNKLMARFSGRPLIRQTVERTLSSKIDGATVVTGHQATRIREALDGLEIPFVHNPDFASGLSSSLKAGVSAVPDGMAGVLVVLGDMPGVSTDDLDRLLAGFRAAGGDAIVRATHDGKRGNPLVIPRALFAAIAQLEGDTGARHLVESGALAVVDVEIGQGASVDVDTRDALERAGGVLQD